MTRSESVRLDSVCRWKIKVTRHNDGWDDVSFHGSPQIPTPNLDVLAADGIILNNYYVQPLCTPSRAALMSGFYPIHTGKQNVCMSAPGGSLGVSLSSRTTTFFFRNSERLEVRAAFVSQWHLGYYTEQYVPTSRGYDTFYGYYNGEEDYYNHTLPVPQSSQVGLDFWLNNEPLRNETDRYSTTLFGEQAIRLIKERDPSKPFFLSLCYQAPHGGAPIELQAPSENVDKFPYIGEKNRTIYAGMVDALDQSVGDVLEVLQQERMLENSVIVFSSDNGGLPWGLHASRGFNWPLRGAKGTLWEGATRAAAFLWSPLVTRNRRVSHQLMHIVDWLPTLYRAAGGDPSKMKRLDGHDMWLQLCCTTSIPVGDTAALRYRDYKLVLGVSADGLYDQRFLTPGSSRPYADLDRLMAASKAARALRDFYNTGAFLFPSQWRERATLTCGPQESSNFVGGDPPYLFDLSKDPCEMHNLAPDNRALLSVLIRKLASYAITSVAPRNKPADPRSYPQYHNGTWAPWVNVAST
ncbi:hypothetical protein HPB49_017436 [Dermacentor silvarum]|uniref:Uncharacterized protein n=1 Tax=Dermacentor silvarum TaxID=543639 RepID=A0ACB8DEY4_DERSI|nr:hypothetical protein HPB49_017436 [Dermacentor silvarum]